MLKRNNRISREAFETILKKGRNITSPLLSLRYLQIAGIDSKFSFVVSGKIMKKAVERNLFKRRGRSIIRKYLPEIKGGFLCAFFARKGIETITFAQLEKETIGLLKKAGLL